METHTKKELLYTTLNVKRVFLETEKNIWKYFYDSLHAITFMGVENKTLHKNESNVAIKKGYSRTDMPLAFYSKIKETINESLQKNDKNCVQRW